VLTLVNLYSRKWLALRAGSSLKGADVTALLEQLKRNGRKPQAITVDNGSEFASKEVDTWSHLNDVKLDFS
jgi:putative transposase